MLIKANLLWLLEKLWSTRHYQKALLEAYRAFSLLIGIEIYNLAKNKEKNTVINPPAK